MKIFVIGLLANSCVAVQLLTLVTSNQNNCNLIVTRNVEANSNSSLKIAIGMSINVSYNVRVLIKFAFIKANTILFTDAS